MESSESSADSTISVGGKDKNLSMTLLSLKSGKHFVGFKSREKEC